MERGGKHRLKSVLLRFGRASEKLSGKSDQRGETDKHVAGLGRLHGGEERGAEQEEHDKKGDRGPRGWMVAPEAQSPPDSKCDVENIQQE